MRAKLSGNQVSVTVSRDEVSQFRQSWPGSRIPHQSIRFEMDARNGDLVGVNVDYDGADIAALSNDATNFAVSKGLLPNWAIRRFPTSSPLFSES